MPTYKCMYYASLLVHPLSVKGTGSWVWKGQWFVLLERHPKVLLSRRIFNFLSWITICLLHCVSHVIQYERISLSSALRNQMSFYSPLLQAWFFGQQIHNGRGEISPLFYFFTGKKTRNDYFLQVKLYVCMQSDWKILLGAYMVFKNIFYTEAFYTFRLQTDREH